MDKLKPCPFCGYEHPTMTYERFPDVFEFRCPNCSLVARFGYCSASVPAGLDAARAKALMAWNRRPVCANDSQTGKGEAADRLEELDERVAIMSEGNQIAMDELIRGGL